MEFNVLPRTILLVSVGSAAEDSKSIWRGLAKRVKLANGALRSLKIEESIFQRQSLSVSDISAKIDGARSLGSSFLRLGSAFLFRGTT